MDKVFGKKPIKMKSLADLVREKQVDKAPVYKDPFVFIANNLTFLIKTKYPIIWDTSSIKQIDDDTMFVPIDINKTFPTPGFIDATKIAAQVMADKDIQGEIAEYLKDTKWSNILCGAAKATDGKGVKNRLGFFFIVKEK